jgi:oxygen-independent coproporphyrinogen III oxidase
MRVYLHFPFCLAKCPYCDFYSVTAEEGTREAYLRALLREMVATRREVSADAGEVLSVYFGGGTPSLYSPGELKSVLDRLGELWQVSPEAEVTVEVNPATWGAPEMLEAAAAGFNRFSLGVQSFDQRVLRMLGRRHGTEESRELSRLVPVLEGSSMGFDLIYGVPGQGLGSWKDTLEETLGYGPHHISAYALTLDPATPMGVAMGSGEVSLPEEEVTVEMYETACRLLGEAGYRHYEISNFALPGRECDHNLACWRREGYLGMGASAHSFEPPYTRRRNLADLEPYMKEAAAGQLPVEEVETLSTGEAWEEEVMLSLRTADGVAQDVMARGGPGTAEAFGGWEALVAGGLAWRRAGRCGLTEQGMFISNHVIAGLFGG